MTWTFKVVSHPGAQCALRQQVVMILLIWGWTAALPQFASAQAPAVPAEESGTTIVAYPIPGSRATAIARELRERYKSVSEVRIAADTRAEQLVVQAPPELHPQIKGQLRALLAAHPTETDQPATAPTEPPADPADRSLNWTQREMRQAQTQLRNIDWRQFLAAVQGMSTNRLALVQSDDGDGLTTTLPAQRGMTQMRVDPQTGRLRLEGEPQLTQAWLQAIRTLDQPVNPSDAARLVPLRNVDPTSISRAVELLRSANERATRRNTRWGADLVGIEDPPPRALAQAQPADQDTNNAQQEPNQPDEATDPQDETVTQIARPGVGLDGALIGSVQIEFVEGLDAIIIRGRKPDVDRVMRIIGEIEELSQFTQPAIELIPLEHVNSQSMADLVTELNAQALALRLGTVTITPLIKPNALLLIGRKEAVDATIDLIRRLDQPVEPASQFRIFHLEHLPATDAVATINAFFLNRTGLGTRVQVQADVRTNALIVYASPRDMAEVQQLIQDIDHGQNAATSEVRVFKLKNALAEELAPVLEATLRGETPPTGEGGQQGAPFGAQPPGQAAPAAGATGRAPRSTTLSMTRIDATGKQVLKSGILTEVRVASDARANSLVVTAPADSMDLIAALVKQLDELPTSEAQIKVFTIVNGDATALTTMLEDLFGQQQQQQGGGQQGPGLQSAAGAGESSLIPLRFSTDPRTNSIIATGSASDLAVVYAVLTRLDAGDVKQRRSQVYRLLNAPAEDVALALNELLRTEREIQGVAPEVVSAFEQIEREVVVVPEIVSNSLIISATPRYFEEVIRIVREIDERPPMVLIQVLIAEIDLDNIEELGVELGIQDSLLFDRSVIANNVLIPGFNFNNQPLGNSSQAQSLATREKTAGQALSDFALGRLNDDRGHGGLVLSASSESVSVLIRALQETSRMDVLSRPQVMTLNNQPAFILVGARVPYIESAQLTEFGTINNTVLENVGLVLGVTPRISPDGLVVMEIDAEKSELGPTETGIPISINQNGDVIRSPIINTTRAQTTVSARSGQTVILGGLITKDRTMITRRVPYLSDIPLLGTLFRFDSVSEGRTELLIIMTPHIVTKPEDAELLNQIESERMSWCLADVIDLHGDVGMSSGGVSRPRTQVIYPGQDPTAEGLIVPNGDENRRMESLDDDPLIEPDAGSTPDEQPSPAQAPLERGELPDAPAGAPLPTDEMLRPRAPLPLDSAQRQPDEERASHRRTVPSSSPLSDPTPAAENEPTRSDVAPVGYLKQSESSPWNFSIRRKKSVR